MRWIIPVSGLARIVRELRSDGMDFVELEFDKGSPIPSNDPCPPCIAFYGFRKSKPEHLVDYEEIDVVTGYDHVENQFGSSRL